MRKKFLNKKWIAFFMAFVLLLGEGMSTMAMGISENSVLLSQNEVMEDVSDNEINIPDEEELDMDSESVSENEILGDAASERELFPGLKSNYTMSSKEMDRKRKLQNHTKDVLGMKDGSDYVSGEILVNAENEETALLYAEAFGGTLKDYFHGIAVIVLGTDAEDKPITVANAIIASADIDKKLPAAWPNYYYHTNSSINIYNDPYLRENSRNIGYDTYQWHHSVIGSRQAWAEGYTGKDVIVAVLDTGINAYHTEFKNKVQTIDVGLGTKDGHFHGTHVSGIIAARANNNAGGVGVAPDASLVSVKVLEDNGSGTSETINKGIYAAIEAGVDIINMSLGGVGYSDIDAQSVAAAYESGIAVFCAAGNDAVGADAYPASYEGAISIAALDNNSHKASFSNYAAKVRYSAPGVDIPSTAVVNNDYYWDSFTDNEQWYTVCSGTSQATPVVAGTAAVLWNVVEGTGTQKVDNLLALMDESCEKVTGKGLGKGCVSLVKALNLDTVTGTPNAPVFSKKAGTYKQEAVEVFIESGIGTTVYYTTNGKNITYKNGKISDGAIRYIKGESITLEGSAAVTLKAIAINNVNGLASKVTSAKYSLKPMASGITIISANGNNVVAQGKSIQLKAELFPSYTADKKVEWKVLNAEAGISVNKSSGKVTVKKDAKVKEYTIRATAKAADGTFTGVFADYNISVLALTNPITAIKVVPKSVTMKSGDAMNVQVSVTKKDRSMGKASDITWNSSDNSIVLVEGMEDGTITLSGIQSGKAKINGIANDGSGKKISFNVTVTQEATSVLVSGYPMVAAGKSITLKASVSPENATNKKVSWAIVPDSDTTGGKVTVNKTSGKVSAVTGASGSCTVRATALDGSGVYGDYLITVTAGKMDKITLEKSSVTIFRKRNQFGSATSAEIEVKTEGSNADSWMVQSSNEDLVTVARSENGIIVRATGKTTGTATVTVMSVDGSNLKKTCKVTVNNPATSLKLAPEKGRSSYIAYGKKLKLIPTFETVYGEVSSSGKKLEWTTDGSYGVAVDKNGNVTAKTPYGDEYSWVKVTARTTDGSNLEASYWVNTCSVTKKVQLEVYGYYGWQPLKGTVTMSEGYYIECYPTPYTNYLDPAPGFAYDIYVNKPGISITYTRDGSIYIVGDKPGTYKITVSCTDGSSAKKSYTFKII